jgi:hypothetical protein
MDLAQDGSGTRRTARARRLVLALALAAGGLGGVSGPERARASCGASDFPFEVTFEGWVDAADEDGFVVDRMRVEYPRSSTVVPWDPARYDVEIDESAIEQGAYVRVMGSLRVDGTILAQSALVVEPEFEDTGVVTYVSGNIEAIDASGMTVDGHDYAFIEEEDRGPVFLLTPASHELPLEDVRTGDAVAFALIVDEDSGETVADTMMLRPTGDGAVLAGRVTENTLDEGGSFFAHEGLYFEVEGVRAFFPYNEDMAIRAVAREHPDDSALLETLAVGDGVRMTGWYRDGVFFVEDLFVDGVGDSTRPARSVMVLGSVASADEEAVEVNGVSFRKPEGRRARRAAEAVQVGDRVRLRARVPAEGEDIVVRSVRRLRRR